FTFTLHNNPIVIQNELDIPISSENANLINKNALGAKLELYITNLLPVGATATAYFSDTPEIDVDNPSTYDYTKEATIFASNTPEGQGEQTVPPITLSESEVKLFGNPNVYLRWKFAFHNSNVPVTIHGSTTDYIQIKGRLSAKIAVED
ncbi:MAG: hypothetical protein PHY48_05425, partial [Candidatus Cloacimonetes bacterium]|nr:hypothetical protein [Candidatus Cloacimonadota bacterium]